MVTANIKGQKRQHHVLIGYIQGTENEKKVIETK